MSMAAPCSSSYDDLQLGSSSASDGAPPREGGRARREPRRRIAIAFLRNDLRVHDNAALYYAHHHSSQPTHVLPVYVFDERQIECSALPAFKRRCKGAKTPLCGFWKTGVFRARFLAESVYDLKQCLLDRGSDLLIRFGLPEIILENIVKSLQERGDEVVGLEAQKEVTTDQIAVEKELADRLKRLGVSQLRLHDTKPMIHKDDLPHSVENTPDVFTPFRKRVEALGKKMVRPMLNMPERFLPFPEDNDEPIEDVGNYGKQVESQGIEAILEYFFEPLKDSYEMKYADPRAPRHNRSAFPWGGGETSALERVEWYFVTGNPPPVTRYKETRNQLVGHAYSTKMSPFLSLGTVSPRMISQALDKHEERYGSSQNTYWVRFELLWRDYFFYVSEKFGDQLFEAQGFQAITHPKMAEKNRAADWVAWDPSNPQLESWMTGRTGIPFIDANIRELRETGFMSNRGRQNVASFLTKDLYFDWRIGAEFFESHLVDHDYTANYGNWQYVAGVGNDPRASRQFNPIKQARDYDPTGEYVRTWIGQLKSVPSSKVHTPWLMSDVEWREYCFDKDVAADKAIVKQYGLSPASAAMRGRGSSWSTSSDGGYGRSRKGSSDSGISTIGSTSGSGRITKSSISSVSSVQRSDMGDDGNVAPSALSSASSDEAEVPSIKVKAASRIWSHSRLPGALASSLATEPNGKSDSIPYPRTPLLEQESWKPHYHRKDLGRRKGYAGGGNSRRLIRAPAEGA